MNDTCPDFYYDWRLQLATFWPVLLILWFF